MSSSEAAGDRSTLALTIGGAREAVGFLTRIPVGARSSATGELAMRTGLWLPIIGLVVGAVLGGARIVAGVALSDRAATAVALGAAMLLTGARGEDGLAATADGLFAGGGIARRAQALRDAQMRNAGTAALLIAVIVAWLLLSGFSGGRCLRAALVGGALSRWSIVPLTYLVPIADRRRVPAGLEGTSGGIVAIASLEAAVIALVFGGLVPGILSIAAAGLMTAVGAWVIPRAFGGATRETLGGVGKLVELVTYAALVLAWQ